MAFIEKGQKKTYISTFRFDLKPSAALQTPLDVPRTEKGTKLTNKEESCLKSDVTLNNTASNNSGAVVEFLDPQQQVVVGVGGTARLDCRFSSSGPVASCWIHDSEKVVLEGPRVCVTNTNSSSTLVLSEVVPADAGSYSLFVRNRGGTAHWTTSLSVIDPPEPPASCPFVSQLTCTSLVLSWSGPCFDGGSAITGYVVEFQRLDQTEPSDWTELTNQCQNTSYRVRSGLDPQGQYRFRVRACNAAGVSDPSEESDCIKMNTAGEPQQEVTSYVEVVPDTTHKARDHYHVHEKLGMGKFGEVYRMTHKQTGRVYAGKFYRARVSREKTAARQEIKLMNELHHPKLVQCLAAYDTSSEIVMILEYVNYMRQILEGIQYIHSKHIIHLDLKPENIVCVNGAGTLIKIIDFGLACKLEPGKRLMVLHGTPEFAAPEVVNYEPVDLATDMWSIGVICYILLSGESPFQGNSDAETLALVTGAQWEFDPESFDDITDEAKGFISGLLRKDKRTRLSCEKALAHPWIALFDDSNSKSTKSLNKDKMRRFLARRKWKWPFLYLFIYCKLQMMYTCSVLQKTGKALLALKRMVRCSKSDAPHSPFISVDANALGKEAEQAVASLEKQLRSEPRFHQALHDLTESCGATVHLACTIQGYPDPEVVWLFDEAPLEKTGRVQMNYDKNGTCTLTLAQVQPGDSGIYKCCASNSLGQALCSAKLTVQL
ncbi:myosin light chain smooth muscle-like protein [Labeo rohita]|uniref:Myosin light chain smooth muscle-like protein n=1 Tax=Labeo rohita TaxID=84645 RepID=A0A498MYY6_LABRO|nr:myosin light chain smooth muscle-like protein [Labeo rohita]RXN24702.1 myosin light chain smooth muscle-like protein [Labeo rohita]